jgi:hypothetical protein
MNESYLWLVFIYICIAIVVGTMHKGSTNAKVAVGFFFWVFFFRALYLGTREIWGMDKGTS